MVPTSPDLLISSAVPWESRTFACLFPKRLGPRRVSQTRRRTTLTKAVRVSPEVPPAGVPDEEPSTATTQEPGLDALQPDTPVLGHFRLEQVLERREHSKLFLADDRERSELVVLAFATSKAALADCLSGFPESAVSRQTTFGFWHVAEIALEDAVLRRFAHAVLSRTASSVSETKQSSSGSEDARLRDGNVFAGRYVIAGVLGSGGAGVVYRARDETFQRDVALKVVRVDSWGDEEEREEAKRRLLKEARFVSQLRHPNIVEIYDAGESAGVPYLVLELCEDGSLRKFMTEGTQEDRVRWLTQIAEALAYAHENGIVHRDVKPENILLTSDGTIKVTDFGIARGLRRDRTENSTLGIVGTPRYMAPEQLVGGPIDGRADQYAWGLVAHELLTGLHPRMAAVKPLPELASHTSHAKVPIHVQRLISRATATDVADRYKDFHALLADFRRAPRHSRWPLFAGAGAAALSVAVALLLASTSINRSNARTPPSGGADEISASNQPLARDVSRVDDMGAGSLKNRGSSVPSAMEHFNVGVQHWLDMSIPDARARFGDAAKADPAFARAHLYYALISQIVDESVRVHHRSAVDHRASLSEEDKRILEALGPSVQNPPNLEETDRRLEQLLNATHSIFVASALAQRRMRLDRPNDALQVLSAVEATRESPAFGAHTRAWIAIAESRTEEAYRELTACLSASPGASSCLRAMATLQANDGLCPEAEATARRWISEWPNSADAYRLLAAALYGRTQSVESARAALEQKWLLTREDERDLDRSADLAWLSLLAGNIDDARHYLDEREHFASLSTDGRERSLAAMIRLDLEYQMMPAEQVRNLVHRYLDQSAAWSVSPMADFRDIAARMLLRTGGMTEQEAVRNRDSWLASSQGGFYSMKSRRWLTFFASLAVTPRLARDAVNNLSEERPFLGLYACNRYCENIIGETFLLAGEPSKALPHLQRAARECGVENALDHVRAYEFLGRTFESLGRPTEACDAYRRILAEWSHVHDSRLVRNATSSMTRLQCNKTEKNNQK